MFRYLWPLLVFAYNPEKRQSALRTDPVPKLIQRVAVSATGLPTPEVIQPQGAIGIPTSGQQTPLVQAPIQSSPVAQAGAVAPAQADVQAPAQISGQVGAPTQVLSPLGGQTQLPLPSPQNAPLPVINAPTQPLSQAVQVPAVAPTPAAPPPPIAAQTPAPPRITPLPALAVSSPPAAQVPQPTAGAPAPVPPQLVISIQSLPTQVPTNANALPRWIYLIGAGLLALMAYIGFWFALLPPTSRPGSLDDGFVRWMESQRADGVPNCVLVDVFDIQQGSTVSATMEHPGGKINMFKEKSCATLAFARIPDGVSAEACVLKLVLLQGQSAVHTPKIEIRGTVGEWHEAKCVDEFKVKTKYLAVNHAAWTASGLDLASLSELRIPTKPFCFAARALGVVLGVIFVMEGLPVVGQFLNFECIIISIHSLSSGFTYLNMTLSFWFRQLGRPVPWYLRLFSSEGLMASCVGALSTGLSGLFFLIFNPSCDGHIMATLYTLSLLVALLFGIAKWRGEASWFGRLEALLH